MPKESAGHQKSVTGLVARFDAGYGNQLYIRGNGPGLSWEKGIPMHCRSADQWVWTTENTSGPVLCKVLVNDQIWSEGEDFAIPEGQMATLQPNFR